MNTTTTTKTTTTCDTQRMENLFALFAPNADLGALRDRKAERVEAAPVFETPLSLQGANWRPHGSRHDRAEQLVTHRPRGEACTGLDRPVPRQGRGRILDAPQ